MARTTGSLVTGGATADQLAVRRHNLSVVMKHLRSHGSRSRARLAAETGLNKATVSSLVAELSGRGLLVEGGTERGAIGRPGLVMEIDERAYVALGAEVNIDYVSVMVLNLRGETVAERRVALDTANMRPATVTRRLAALVSTLLDPLVEQGSIPVGLTLGVPGLTDNAAGVVHDAPNLGWRNQPVVEQVREHLGRSEMPIHLDNEANLAALAELDARSSVLGPDDAAPDLLLLTGAVGVGGGVVTGGELLRGARGYAGELGHMQVDRRGATCRCGRSGCWETVVGLNALLALAAPASDPVRDPSVDLVKRLAELRDRAEAGDKRTLRAIDRVGEWLVAGCGSLLNIFNPDVLVLGGYFAVLGPWFRQRLLQDLPAHVFAPDSGGVRIELSELGFSSAVRGGALRATHAVLDDPTLAPLRTQPEQTGAIS